MAINGISTQQVSGVSPNAGVSANGGAVIERVERHQRGGKQGHHACGAHGDGTGQPGAPPTVFTPLHDHNGNKMVYLESRSASGVVSHMPLKFEQLESLSSEGA